jgi:hypothetical protein
VVKRRRRRRLTLKQLTLQLGHAALLADSSGVKRLDAGLRVLR